MDFEGILFDLDGTLWSAVDGIAISWGQVFEGEPDIRPIPSAKDYEKVMGMAPMPLMKCLLPYISDENRLHALFERCCTIENEYLTVHGGKLFDGIEDMLSSLSKTHKLFIVSNCNTGYIDAFLDAHGLRKYITDYECAGTTGFAKHDNIKLVIKRNSLSSAVYVGDTEIDMDAARRAGIPFIYAAYGFGDLKCETSINSPLELISLLSNGKNQPSERTNRNEI